MSMRTQRLAAGLSSNGSMRNKPESARQPRPACRSEKLAQMRVWLGFGSTWVCKASQLGTPEEFKRLQEIANTIEAEIQRAMPATNQPKRRCVKK